MDTAANPCIHVTYCDNKDSVKRELSFFFSKGGSRAITRYRPIKLDVFFNVPAKRVSSHKVDCLVHVSTLGGVCIHNIQPIFRL